MAEQQKDQGFNPDLTPQQMETLGVLGPQYFEANAKEHNYFGVNASMKKWPKKWIDDKTAPQGWFQWYKGYHSGKRTSDDERQIKRWKSFKARHLAQLKKADPNLTDLTVQPRRRQALLNWGIAPGLNVEKALKTARKQKQMKKQSSLQKLADSNKYNRKLRWAQLHHEDPHVVSITPTQEDIDHYNKVLGERNRHTRKYAMVGIPITAGISGAIGGLLSSEGLHSSKGAAIGALVGAGIGTGSALLAYKGRKNGNRLETENDLMNRRDELREPYNDQEKAFFESENRLNDIFKLPPGPRQEQLGKIWEKHYFANEPDLIVDHDHEGNPSKFSVVVDKKHIKQSDYHNTLNSVTDPKSSFNTLQGSTSGGALGAALGNILERRTGKKLALPMALAGGTSGGLIAHKASKESRKDQENFRTQVMDAIQKQSSMNNKYLDKIAESSENQPPEWKKRLYSAGSAAALGLAGYSMARDLKGAHNLKKGVPIEDARKGTHALGVLSGLTGAGAGAAIGYGEPVRKAKQKARKAEKKRLKEESKNQEKTAQVLDKLAKSPTIKKSHKGLLHKKLGIPEDQEIPLSKLRAAKAKAKKNGDKKLEQEATFAINAKTKWD